ncbi:MAG: hypothetical protein IKR68_04395 [Lachnospiraceae bacterium]|nr:hypothetical protein [Lachnospiraceae bacterium]
MNKKIKWILIVMAVLFAIFCVVAYLGIRDYTDTHTWATVTVSGTDNGETADAYYYQQECLKNDQISIGTLTLVVTDIKHDGTLSFSVKNGELKNYNGETITSDVLQYGVQKNYSHDTHSFSLCITDKRYQ